MDPSSSGFLQEKDMRILLDSFVEATTFTPSAARGARASDAASARSATQPLDIILVCFWEYYGRTKHAMMGSKYDRLQKQREKKPECERLRRHAKAKVEPNAQ